MIQVEQSRFHPSSLILHPCILLLIGLLLCASSCVPEDERYKEIRPGIKATTSGVEVTNKDSFNYPKVTVYLNGNFETFVGDIPAGKTVSLPFEKFTDGGARFDISVRKLRYIRVKAMFGKNASDINFEVH
ncbi:MAG: hypothetical protein WBP93_14735 [Pyrinomonadaceae bacterium]